MIPPEDVDDDSDEKQARDDDEGSITIRLEGVVARSNITRQKPKRHCELKLRLQGVYDV